MNGTEFLVQLSERGTPTEITTQATEYEEIKVVNKTRRQKKTGRLRAPNSLFLSSGTKIIAFALCRHLMLSSPATATLGISYFPHVYVLVVHDMITHTHTWQFHLAVCFFHAQIHGTIHRHEKRGCWGTELRDARQEQLFFFLYLKAYNSL